MLPWFRNEQDQAFAMAPIFFFFGMILLAVDSFGREFSLGTFSSLMAQPIERRRIWRTKITVLFFAAGLSLPPTLPVADCGCIWRLTQYQSAWGPLKFGGPAKSSISMPNMIASVAALVRCR